MDDDLSSVIEHALQYASPLPVLEVTSTDNPSTAIQQDNSDTANILQLNNDITKNNGTDNVDASSENSATCDTLLYGHRVTIDTTGNDGSNGGILNLLPVTLERQHDRNEIDNSVNVGQLNIDLYATQHEPVQNVTVSINSRPVPEHTVSSSFSPSSCSLQVESPSNVIPKVKKTRKRVKNPDPPPEPILPPCSICDEKSSGYHYGANTCEACKGFFRRTLKKKEVGYKCKCKPDMREEWERGPIKNGCASCRYKRCLKVGMSKEAIKIGRYTLKHKTKNINQVKNVESIDSLIDVAMASIYESNPSSASGLELGISWPEDITSPLAAVESEISSSCRSDYDNPSPPAKKAKPDPVSSLTSQNSIVSLKEIDSIVRTLTESQSSADFDDFGHIPTEVIKQKQTEYLEKYNMKKELFGDMGLSKAEFDEFYSITGIDLDGRIEHVQRAFTFFEQKISVIVSFAKSIPGFKSLKMNDQANLIKASRIENTLFGGYRGILRNFDMERRVLTTPWGKEIHMDELARIVPIHFVLTKFKYSQSVRDLDLTVQEESVVRAIVTTFSDRCSLEEPQKVERIQEKLVACLQHLLSIRPGGPGSRLYRIFNLLTNFRDFSENENEFTRKMLKDWPMLSTNKYELLKEFIA
ncbi:nuclear receptor ROR-beta-like [Mercenaria mercenaria]|uniref:nuclear receptor ROR-beta-like n=1 Tax=Mercenaria mercenaria TaxID=6596 RepID=UPI00234EEAEA|nr:nuclear receptor ROR-beta-like [Mercenaria mercenaria]XP_053382220.1 nuclear receptor ROR-beta-like [Mercenaria mercenaria]